MITRLVVALVLALLALAGGAASHAQVAPVIDPCPVMAVRLPGGHVQPIGCAVFLPSVEVRR
jgi:hypothetical protein